MRSTTVWLIIGVVLVVVAGIVAIVALDTLQPAAVNVDLTNKVIGLVMLVVPGFVTLIQSALNAKSIAETKQRLADATRPPRTERDTP